LVSGSPDGNKKGSSSVSIVWVQGWFTMFVGAGWAFQSFIKLSKHIQGKFQLRVSRGKAAHFSYDCRWRRSRAPRTEVSFSE
jgi:hypothetical protein